ncbi:aldo/keto reductase, partial [Candidatus Magnetomorum sp. HK-1]
MIPKREMGNTGINLSLIGLGGWQLFDINNEKESLSIIDNAIEMGINFCETACYYGQSEAIIAKCLKNSHSDSLVVSTKCGKNKNGQFDISPKHINCSKDN